MRSGVEMIGPQSRQQQYHPQLPRPPSQGETDAMFIMIPAVSSWQYAHAIQVYTWSKPSHSIASDETRSKGLHCIVDIPICLKSA